MTSNFASHTIVVTVGGSDDEIEYAIDHGRCEERGEECLVEQTVRELGLQSALYGVFDNEPPVSVGEYRVRGWVSKTEIPGEPVEFDAGIEEVGDDDDD